MPEDQELNKETLAMLRKAFDAFDREKKGSISTDMVGTILQLLGVHVTEKMLKEIIDEVDEDGSEEDAEETQKELREAFRLYDKEGNGYITTGTLRVILRELDDKLTEDELDEIIDEIDEDGSGTIDFDEFMEMMTGE